MGGESDEQFGYLYGYGVIAYYIAIMIDTTFTK